MYRHNAGRSKAHLETERVVDLFKGKFVFEGLNDSVHVEQLLCCYLAFTGQYDKQSSYTRSKNRAVSKKEGKGDL